MNRLLPLIITAFVLLGHPAWARTWTNTEGKKVKGKMMRFEDDIVYIKRDRDGKTLRIQIDRLSEADQTFVLGEAKPTPEAIQESNEKPSEVGNKDALKLLGLTMAGLGVFAISVLIILGIIYLLIHALIIHISTRMLGFTGGYGHALLAAFISWVFGGLSKLLLMAVSIASNTLEFGLIIPLALLFGGLSIKLAYQKPFGISLIAYIVSIIVSIVIAVIFGAILLMLGIGAMMGAS